MTDTPDYAELMGRLREDCWCDPSTVARCRPCQAADAIERLTKERDLWMKSYRLEEAEVERLTGEVANWKREEAYWKGEWEALSAALQAAEAQLSQAKAAALKEAAKVAEETEDCDTNEIAKAIRALIDTPAPAPDPLEESATVDADIRGFRPEEGDWQLVPKEPTVAMCLAAGGHSFRDVYKNMMAVAPAPPPMGEEEIARVLYECERKRGELAREVMSKASGKDCAGILIDPWEECKDTFLSDARAVIAHIYGGAK
jgi:hypothetical protein